MQIDAPYPIRPGEELDSASLSQYLLDNLDGFSRINAIQQFPGGFSNLTYLLETNLGEWVLRRPPFGANIRSAHDMGREFRVLSLLAKVYPKVPKPVLYCPEEQVIGAPFYLMERIKGTILRSRPPKGMDLDEKAMRRLSEATVDNLVQLHAIDLQQHGLSELGKPEGYVERQVLGWIERYRKAETHEIASMNLLADWMPLHFPSWQAPALIHNDYKYDNLVLDPADPGHILAVLDWEMATIGDPLMDLGVTLGYWMEGNEAANMPVANLTWLPGNLSRAEIVARYAEQSGRDVQHILFYYLFGLFKIGVIVQQIFVRYQKGHTADPRFAGLIDVVRAIGKLGQAGLERGGV